MTFFLTFLVGICVYNLKLVSIKKLIENLSLEAYPILMAFQGLLIFIFINSLNKITKKSPKLFYYGAFIYGGLVVAFANFIPESLFGEKLYINIFSCLIFLMSTLAVMIIELSLKDLQTKNISILKNPNFSGQLCFSFEMGVIGGAIGTLLGSKISNHLIEGLINTSCFFASLFVLIFLIKKTSFKAAEKTIKEVPPNKEFESEEKVDIFRFPFVPLMMMLAGILLLSKHIQGFGVILGFVELKKTSGLDISVIFSYLNLAQTGIILFLLLPSLLKLKFQKNTWGNGIKIFLFLQSVSMGLLTFFSPALALIGFGAMRKITQHTFLNKSLPILESTIPKFIRFKIKNNQEKFGQSISYFALALLSGIYIYSPIPSSFLWILGFGMAIWGLVIRKKLLGTINRFQVANITQVDVFEAVNACYSLGNSESQLHSKALINLLNQHPRPFLAKAIIFSLGRMEKNECIPHIIKYYNEYDREDIQLACVEALLNYKSYDVDLFFTKSLQDLIIKNTSLGELRVNVFKAISTRLKSTCVLTLLQLLNKSEKNDSIIANTIIFLGEIAYQANDESVYAVISKYLDEKYSRRIRSNSILYLYRSKVFHIEAQEALDTFLTSKEFFDRSAVAFLAGNLKIKGLIPFVLKNSFESKHSNSTILVSLIKLGYVEACEWFATLVMCQNEVEALTSLNQLNTVEDVQMRYLVYENIFKQFPDSAEILRFLNYLRKTKRNFDHDRQVIRNEAIKLGMSIVIDKNLFDNQTEDIGRGKIEPKKSKQIA